MPQRPMFAKLNKLNAKEKTEYMSLRSNQIEEQVKNKRLDLVFY